MDSNEELIFNSDDEMGIVITEIAVDRYSSQNSGPRLCRTSKLMGHEYILELINGHENSCFDQFRMDPPVFVLFCEELKK